MNGNSCTSTSRPWRRRNRTELSNQAWPRILGPLDRAVPVRPAWHPDLEGREGPAGPSACPDADRCGRGPVPAHVRHRPTSRLAVMRARSGSAGWGAVISAPTRPSSVRRINARSRVISSSDGWPRWRPTRQGRSLQGIRSRLRAGSARRHASGQVRARRGPERRRTGCTAGGHRGATQRGRSNTSACRNDPTAGRTPGGPDRGKRSRSDQVVSRYAGSDRDGFRWTNLR